MGFKSKFATGAGRSTSWLLQNVAKRTASQLPGRVALSLDNEILKSLARKPSQGSIVVCGTNGKTTTNNMVASAIEASRQKVLCNRAGANMLPGVVAALLPGSKCDWAVMESDELSTVNILPDLKPKYLVLLNLFRDQLDRAGEIDNVQNAIYSALEQTTDTAVVVNADDPLCYFVAYKAAKKGNETITFGIGEKFQDAQGDVAETRFCQNCLGELEYDYRHYAQLGSYTCPNCDFGRPELDFKAINVVVNQDSLSFDVESRYLDDTAHLRANFGGAYMVYNLLAAFSAAVLAGTTPSEFQSMIDSYNPSNGRLQKFVVDGRQITLNLAKNPTGFNQNISLMLNDERRKNIMFSVNDNDNDGCDISWIWDIDFERLTEANVGNIYVGGIRANDMQVRMKYAGLSATIADSVEFVINDLKDIDADEPLYVIPNYSALLPAKNELDRLGEKHV